VTPLFEPVKRLARKLNLPTSEITAKDAKGSDVQLLQIAHKPYNLLVFDRGGYYELSFVWDIDEKDAALLAQQSKEIQERLFLVLRREILEGRTGFEFRYDQTKTPPWLLRIVMVQRIVIRDESPTTLQRFADGIQEVVVVGVRCQDVLMRAFGDIRGGEKAPDTYHVGMYA